MGDVYVAYDPFIDRTVAIKVCTHDDGSESAGRGSVGSPQYPEDL